MSYEMQGLQNMLVPAGTGVLGAETLTASAAEHGEFLVMKRCALRRISFCVTTAVSATTTAPVVTFTKRVTPGSATGSSTIGTLTIPDTTAIGKVVYKDIEPVELNVGDSVLLNHTTQATGSGSPAGAGYYGFEVYPLGENISEQSDAVASA